LAARGRFEADHRLGGRRRPHAPDERFQLRIAAYIPGGPDLFEEADGRELRIRGEARFDDRLVGLDLRRHRRPRPIAHGLAVEIAIEIARANPSVDRVSADAQLACQRAFYSCLAPGSA
jgi:hypothetical protein